MDVKISAEPLAPLPDTATTHSSLVAEAIREAILTGRLKPGALLVERRIAKMLGVSKTPIREALIGLARSGLVKVSPNRGVRVADPTPSDMRKIYQLRSLLEPWAIAQAAVTKPDTALRRAEEALDEADRLLASGDHVGMSLANRRFHRLMYGCCGNELVVAALDELQDLVALGVVNLLWHRWPTWESEFHEHRQILTAVQAGDTKRAELVAREHIAASLARLDSTSNDT